jgi:predicted ArsR family transcriptional regulator
VDRLTLLKALADDSRYALYSALDRSRSPLSTLELAERLDLHPNTVRLHLERLREAGLVEVSAASHGSVGRPQHHWRVTATAPSLGLEPPGLRVLADLLAEAAGSSGVRAEELVSIGRRRGETRTAGGEAPVSPSAAGGNDGDGVPACVQAALDELADLGFDPVLEGSLAGPTTPGRNGPDVAAETDEAAPTRLVGRDGSLEVAFTGCPFRELAVAYPDVVCRLHHGLTEGIVAAASARVEGAGAAVVGFSTLVDPDPCRATLTVVSAGTADRAPHVS